MKYKNWSPEIWQRIQKALATELKENAKPVAAFDADGTLWDVDLGETFFKYQIKKKLLANLPADPWKHYRDWKNSGDPRPAYLWLAQINHGHSINEVRKWAEDSIREISPMPIFEDQKKLIELLQKSGVEVFIVTASVKWAVEPGAARLNVPSENVIGVATKVIKGKVSDEADGHMTYREGKASALKSMVPGRLPFLCSGNTMGDLDLMMCATKIQLAVGAADESSELFATEERLRQEAKARNWLIHRY